MLELSLVHAIAILVCHFIGDFILQTDDMAVNKSTSNEWLTKHVIMYCFPLTIFYMVLLSTNAITPLAYILVLVLNFIFHWLTDYVTSRVSAKFYKAGERGKFFKMIGFDQLIHGVTLFTLHVILV